MTYAIGHIIYGIDLTPDAHEEDPLKEHLSKEAYEEFQEDPDAFGCLHAYSGNGEAPVWIGVTLATFDECNNFPLSEIAQYLNASPETMAKWNDVLEHLDPELYSAMLECYGTESPEGSGRFVLKPEVLVVWGSS